MTKTVSAFPVIAVGGVCEGVSVGEDGKADMSSVFLSFLGYIYIYIYIYPKKKRKKIYICIYKILYIYIYIYKILSFYCNGHLTL